jgi:SAM-dependent methyltransferase
MAGQKWTRSRAGRREVEIWETLGASDPDWGVLSDRSLAGGGWESRIEDFYASGQGAIDGLIASLPPTERRLAIDWGSGTGRLTFALAKHCDRVVGVDISSSMLQTARERAADRGIGNVEFVAHDSFEPGGDADLVISILVLQHAPSLNAVRADIATMAAAVAPAGWLVVQLPFRARNLRARLQLGRRIWKLLRPLGIPVTWLARFSAGFGMLLVPEATATEMIAASGMSVMRTRRQDGFGFDYLTYYAQKPTA